MDGSELPLSDEWARGHGRRRLEVGLVAAGTGIALGTLAYARWVERLRIEVVRTKVTIASSRVPRGGLRILQLSDLHFTGQGRVEQWKIARTVRLLSAESYDLLLVTGDLLHDDAGLPAALDLIDRLPRPKLGAFACLGNHDYACYSWLGPARVAWREAEPGQELKAAVVRTVEMCRKIVRNERLYLGQEHNDTAALKQALERRGIRVLDNQSFRLTTSDADLWLVGIDDLMEGRPQIAAAMAGMPEDEVLRIVLAHNPDLMLDPALHRVDLVLSGHVHGGQILLPGLGALHTQGTHLSRRRTSGWFEYGQARTYVSRGLGEGVRLRFNCRPEVALIQVTGSRECA